MSEFIKEGEKVVIKLDKDIVASNVEEIKKELKQELAEGMTEITIDLSSVEMMDSMGIGILIATHNSLKKLNSQLNLINTSDDISKLLRTMRLHEHFNIAN
jgi:anti-sigma B factor antagonist